MREEVSLSLSREALLLSLWIRKKYLESFRKHILSPFHLSPMDGVSRTMVIAGKTIRARTIVLPLGWGTFYVIYRTKFGT